MMTDMQEGHHYGHDDIEPAETDRTDELEHNANGSNYCPSCHRIVILFDDDRHYCDGTPWMDEPIVFDQSSVEYAITYMEGER